MMYKTEAEDLVKVDKAFTYHPPKGTQVDRYVALRALARQLAESFLMHCPPSLQRSLAMTKLEESIMWANASIARNE